MGSDESHFNVSLTVEDRVTRQCPQTTTSGRAESDSNRGPSDELMLNVLICQLTYQGQVVTNAEARFNNSLRPRKPEGSLGRTAQDVHLDSHTAPEL